MTVAIIAYKGGNILSLQNALDRLGVRAQHTSDAAAIRAADRVIFPGVGSAAAAMPFLQAQGLDEVICSLEQPVLGICLGMQLLCTHSEEGDTPCLGIIPQKVRRFIPHSPGIKVPHMGWNLASEWPENRAPGAYFYFVHSYYAEVGPSTTMVSQHGLPFSAALRQDNFWATQFHPEKSGTAGEAFLKQFLDQSL